MKLCGLSFYLIASLSWAQNVAALDFTIEDNASLQRGATVFMNYCAGCHSLNYLRYNQMAKGLSINNADVLKNNLIFTQARSSDPIKVALPLEDAQQWFGLKPPDLSLIAQQKGASWLFQYLTGFYNDRNRPFGVNNIVVPNVAMPDVLESLRGQQRLVINGPHPSFLESTKPGELSPNDFEETVTDLVRFLVYVGDPTQLERYKLGSYVIFFLFILLIPLYCLKKMYWIKK
jgi:ubiquinol-cytochrome c reductase cytochrome c1 subunit